MKRLKSLADKAEDGKSQCGRRGELPMIKEGLWRGRMERASAYASLTHYQS